MPEELKKFQTQINALKKEFSSFQDEYGEPDKLGAAELKEAEAHLKELQGYCSKLKARTANPVPGVLKDVKVYSEQIEEALGKIERGINYTGNIEHSLKSMKDLFESYEDSKKDIETLDSDMDSMDNELSDAEHSLGRRKESSDIRQIVVKAMKKARMGKPIIF